MENKQPTLKEAVEYCALFGMHFEGKGNGEVKVECDNDQ